jgi:WXG100 family type VII secretion target
MALTMAESFRVDPDALHDAVQRMAEFHQHAESVLSEIDSLVTNLHATWSGRAAAAHAEAHRHWARGEAMMRESLARLRAADATAHA